MRRQHAASSNFLFRKRVLLCKQVERRKGERRGGSVTSIGSGGHFDALVEAALDQALARVLEFDEEVGCPGFVVMKELPLTEPLLPVGALR
jgi:predicted NUDIX family phosphoesterase